MVWGNKVATICVRVKSAALGYDIDVIETLATITRIFTHEFDFSAVTKTKDAISFADSQRIIISVRAYLCDGTDAEITSDVTFAEGQGKE